MAVGGQSVELGHLLKHLLESRSGGGLVAADGGGLGVLLGRLGFLLASLLAAAKIYGP